MSTSNPCSIVRWDGVTARPAVDELAGEEPLEIRVRGPARSASPCGTPGHDEELAAGFLLTEGIVRRREDLLRVEHCGRNDEGNVVNVLLAAEVHVDFERLTRHVFASSSCGLCGKASIDAVRGQFAAIDADAGGPRIDAAVLASLPNVMRGAQASFDRTGGLHAAAVFDARGSLRRPARGRRRGKRGGQGDRPLPAERAGAARPARAAGQRAAAASRSCRRRWRGACRSWLRVGTVEPRRAIRGRQRSDARRLPPRRADERLLRTRSASASAHCPRTPTPRTLLNSTPVSGLPSANPLAHDRGSLHVKALFASVTPRPSG